MIELSTTLLADPDLPALERGGREGERGGGGKRRREKRRREREKGKVEKGAEMEEREGGREQLYDVKCPPVQLSTCIIIFACKSAFVHCSKVKCDILQ